MVKQGMIQREKKRERLVIKHINKRESLKNELKEVSSFPGKVSIIQKI